MKNSLWTGLVVLGVALTAGELSARPGGGARGARGPSAAARPSAAGRAGAARPELNEHRGGPADLKANQVGERGLLDRRPDARPVDAQRLNEHLGLSSETPSNASQRRENFAAANRPFSPAWNAAHPRAWQYTHPHADAWAVASLASATAWLGIPVYETSDESTDTTDAEPAAEPAPDAVELARLGAADVSDTAEWLPLGVYSLNPHEHGDETHLVHIAVNKDGILRGSYHDVLSNDGQTLQGAVDKSSQRAAWTIGPQGSGVFHTTLRDLTAPTTPVTVQLENGQTANWFLTRLEANDGAKQE